jgi:hypothetical protein
MPDLKFEVVMAEVEPFAVGPLLRFKLRVSQSAPSGGELPAIHAVTLQCQLRIEPARRGYAAAEQEKLVDLFDTTSRWGQTVRPLLWTHTSVAIGAFTDLILVDLPVPCTYDFNLAVTKYFHAMEDGVIPVTLLFSGTMFHEGEDGALQVAQIPWDREADFHLPVSVWKAMMERYYPNSAWLCLRKDVFDRLYQFKSRRALPTWEDALETLLRAPEDGCVPAPAAGRDGEKALS